MQNQLINIENTDITKWDFESIKKELAAALSVYETTDYSAELIKVAKADKSVLSKAKTIIENQRKAYKAKCMQPYYELEPKIKELVAMIDNQKVIIDNHVTEYNNHIKQEKEKNIKAYFLKKADKLGDLAETVYKGIFNPKWLNLTTKTNEYRQQIDDLLSNIYNDIEIIKSWNSPFEDTVIDFYAECLSIDKADQKNMELIDAVERAGIKEKNFYDNNDKAIEVPFDQDNMPFPEVLEDSNHIKNTETDKGTLVKIYADRHKLNMIFDYIKSLGADYKTCSFDYGGNPDTVTKRELDIHGIKYLCHFTNVENLHNIFKYGIYPKDDLLKESIGFKLNDVNRFEHCTDASCLSISFPNYRMFYKYKINNPGSDWAVIKIKPDVLYKMKCSFSWTNAASSRINNVMAVRDRNNKSFFNEMFGDNEDFPDAPRREYLKSTYGLEDSFPTDPQAEVLVFDKIGLDDILEVCFESVEVMNKYIDECPSLIKCSVDASLFEKRVDYSSWGGVFNG